VLTGSRSQGGANPARRREPPAQEYGQPVEISHVAARSRWLKAARVRVPPCGQPGISE
jgi:hypothetical protein